MEVLLSRAAAKYLDRLNEPGRGRIKAALAGLEKEPPEGDIVPIAGQAGYFRLRVGDFRALFRIENNVVFVAHIIPRGQAYAKKPGGKNDRRNFKKQITYLHRHFTGSKPPRFGAFAFVYG
ncbi:MAG: type II toxin-antitoxin system RelE/ParE family toxin [Spirochaetales bacterium]|nr:type II toxin-antitoxin system RelE/ParE family toxin [Spirochaetales bacterium]